MFLLHLCFCSQCEILWMYNTNCVKPWRKRRGQRVGQKRHLRYAGRLWFARGARCRDEPLTGFVPKRWAASSPQQMSRADLAAELSVFFALKKSCQHLNFTNLPITHICNWSTSNFITMHILWFLNKQKKERRNKERSPFGDGIISGKDKRVVSLTGKDEHFIKFASIWRTDLTERRGFHLVWALWLFIVYFAIYKLKEGTKDDNNLYNKTILNV